nr:hypothetical protein GCM10020093_072540 [Planobispora longispora]
MCALTVGTAIPVGAVPGEPGPSADEVARARTEARERDALLGTATARLAEARAELEQLTVHAEKLIEAYNGELVKTARAEELSRQAGSGRWRPGGWWRRPARPWSPPPSRVTARWTRRWRRSPGSGTGWTRLTCGAPESWPT